MPAETVWRDRHQVSGKPHGGRGHDGPDWNDGSDESRRICEHCSTSSGSSSAASGWPWDTGPPASSAASSSSPSPGRSEEHTSELQSRGHLVCRLLLEKKKHNTDRKKNHNCIRPLVI